MKLLIPFLVLSFACGDDDIDLSGVYSVTLHTENDADCEVEGADVEDPPFFSMESDQLFGFDIFTFNECTSAEPQSCSAGGLFFQIATDDGWRNQQSAVFGGATCSFSYQEATAIFDPNGDLRIESRRYEEDDTFDFDDPRCTTDEAEARGDSMPCAEFLVIVGTPVTD